MSHGKTAQMIADAIKAALAKPEQSVVYVCPDREEVRRWIWGEFQRALQGQVESPAQMHTIRFPNGSIIRLIRQDEEKRAHGLVFDKVTGEAYGPFWSTRLRP